MANKTIYTCTNSDNQLELSWSEDGIHFSITQQDRTYLCDLQFDEFDIEKMVEELELYSEAYITANKNKANLG
jgi:hypothetical protein